MRLRPLAPALTLLALGGAPAVHAQDAGGFDAADTLQRFLTDARLFRANSATVGAVETSGDTVTARDVAMKWSMNFGSDETPVAFTADVTLPSLSVGGLAPEGARWRAASIAIPEAKISVGVVNGEERIAYDVTARDYQMTDASWARLPAIADNAAAPVSRFAPLVDWAVSQSYAKATFAGIDATFTAPGSTQQVTYGGTEIGPVKDGVTAAFRFGDVRSTQTVEMPSQDLNDEPGTTVPTTITLTQGGYRGENVDARALAQLLTGKGDATGPVPMIGTAATETMTLSFGDMANITIGPSVIERLTVDPSRGPLLSALDPIVAAALNGEEPSPEDVTGLLLDLYGAFGIERYSLASFDAAFTGGHAKMGEIAVEDLSAAGLGRFGMGGIDVDATGVTAKLGNFEVADVVFPPRDSFMQIVMGSMAGMQPSPEAALAAMPQVGRVTLDGVAFTAPAMGDVALTKFETRLENFINGIPTRNAITLSGLRMPAAFITDPTTQMIISTLGLTEIAADGTLTLGWDEDTQRVELDNDITVQGVGQLKANAALGGIPQYVIEEPARAQEAVATASLVGLSARFADQGLTNALLDLVASQSGVSKADFVAGIASQVSMQVAMLTGDSALGEQISGALSTFLNEPRSLDLQLAPANPVPVAQVMGAAMTAPQSLPGLLNFSITANQ